MKEAASRYFVASAVTVETLAIKAAFLEAISSQYSELEFFLDCKNFITMIKSNGSTFELQGILHDIRVLSSFFPSVLISFTLLLKML